MATLGGALSGNCSSFLTALKICYFYFLMKDNFTSCFMGSNCERVCLKCPVILVCVMQHPLAVLWDGFFPQYNVKRMRWVLFCSYHMLICGVIFSFYYENNITVTFKIFF